MYLSKLWNYSLILNRYYSIKNNSVLKKKKFGNINIIPSKHRYGGKPFLSPPANLISCQRRTKSSFSIWIVPTWWRWANKCFTYEIEFFLWYERTIVPLLVGHTHEVLICHFGVYRIKLLPSARLVNASTTSADRQAFLLTSKLYVFPLEMYQIQQLQPFSPAMVV